MDVQPPQLGWAFEHEDDEAAQTLDAVFAQILNALMNDEISAASSVQHFRDASMLAMQQYRESASSLLHRAAHYIHARRLASELEEQAASWQLLQHLYCSGYTPAGDDLAGAADAGEMQTYRELAAGLVNDNNQLRRCAQVVCWLESLAAQRLQEAPPARFAHHEGLWRETLLTSSSSSSAMVELDPDAPGRGKSRLAAGDAQGEERLAAHLWQLIRAGKVHEAGQLCCQAGQAWRCLSISGGGPWGPLPLGEAASDSAQKIDQQTAADELSWQVDGGIAAAQIAWKWACYAAAEAAGSATPGNRWEAAVYGAMCGHVLRMLPVCSSWEDEVWAYCRSWLDLQTDAELLEELETGEEAVESYLVGNQQEEDLVSTDLLMGVLSKASSTDYSRNTDSRVLKEGLAVTAGQWPVQKLLREGERSIIPRNFHELLQFVSNSSNSNVRAASKDQQRILQLLVMSEDWQSVMMELTAAASIAAEQLQQLRQKKAQQQGADQADAGMEFENSGTSMLAGDEDALEMSADSATGVLRFVAHWALSLRALGLLYDDAWLDERDDEEQKDLARLQLALGNIVHQYSLMLAQQPHSLFLVPLYLCHLRQTLRESLLDTLLASANDILDDDACQALYLQLFAATEGWRQRQDRLRAVVLDQGKNPGPYWDAEEGEEGQPKQPSSCLYGDLRDEELRLLLQHWIRGGFSSSTTSPLQRCRQLRWLFYGYTGQQQQQSEQLPTAGTGTVTADGIAGSWQNIWRDALQFTLDMASEMVIYPKLGSSVLQVLMEDVLPQDFAQVAPQAAASHFRDVSEQLQVLRQVQALSFWQVYVGLDARYQQWREEWGAAYSGTKGDSAKQLAQCAEKGKALVSDMLQLALQDSLRLPAQEDLVQHLSALAAGSASAAEADLVAAGEWMALPRFDSSDERPTEMMMALTVAVDDADPDVPFQQLQEPDAQQLMKQLQDRLAHLVHTTPGVSAETTLPAPSTDLAGTVLVKLTSFNTDLAERAESDISGSRLASKMDRAWQDMVQVASEVLSSGDSPKLAVVHMRASTSTRLALCRRRTTSKLLRRSGKVLLDLARAGHSSPELDVLICAAGDAAGREGPQLLELLPPSQAAKLLACLELAIEEGGLNQTTW